MNSSEGQSDNPHPTLPPAGGFPLRRVDPNTNLLVVPGAKRRGLEEERGRVRSFPERVLWTCLCLGYIVLILGTLTLARSLSRWGNQTLGFENLLLGVNGLYGLLLLAVLADFRRRGVSWAGLACVLGIAGIAAAALTTIRLPEERIHFIEYILLVSVAWKMFRTWEASRPVLAAFCMAVGVGILDETIQRFLPQRVFDWRDIGFNAFGALLGTGLLAIRIRFGHDGAPSAPLRGR